eukprot:37749_1
MSDNQKSHNFRELSENLSHTFLKNFNQNKRNSTLNPSKYLSQICFNSSDSFRDKLFNFDPMRFSFSNFSDELTAKNENKNQNEYSTFHAEIEEEGELNINKKR